MQTPQRIPSTTLPAFHLVLVRKGASAPSILDETQSGSIRSGEVLDGREEIYVLTRTHETRKDLDSVPQRAWKWNPKKKKKPNFNSFPRIAKCLQILQWPSIYSITVVCNYTVQYGQSMAKGSKVYCIGVGQSLTGSRESGLHNVDQSLTSHLTVEQP